jgi:hypothetical protein
MSVEASSSQGNDKLTGPGWQLPPHYVRDRLTSLSFRFLDTAKVLKPAPGSFCGPGEKSLDSIRAPTMIPKVDKDKQ